MAEKRKVRCPDALYILLKIKSKQTGRTIPEILEYAQIPFIPPKNKMKGKRLL